MNANLSPRDQQIINAHAIAQTWPEFERIVSLKHTQAYYHLKRLGLPLFHPRSNKPDLTARNKEICERYEAGATVTEVAVAMGLTRGQAAGVIERAGLFGTKLQPRRAQGVPRSKAQKPQKPQPKARNQSVFSAVALSAPRLNLTLDDLTSTTCRNPDPECDNPRDQTYCGQPVFGSLPYCAACARINYMPPQARDREPRPRA